MKTFTKRGGSQNSNVFAINFDVMGNVNAKYYACQAAKENLRYTHGYNKYIALAGVYTHPPLN